MTNKSNIVFASTDRVDAHSELLAEFMNQIFGIKEYLVTDESTLSDFSACCLPDGFGVDMSYNEVLNKAEEKMLADIYINYGVLTYPEEKLIALIELIDFENREFEEHK